jgi:hypothetical protein
MLLFLFPRCCTFLASFATLATQAGSFSFPSEAYLESRGSSSAPLVVPLRLTTFADSLPSAPLPSFPPSLPSFSLNSLQTLNMAQPTPPATSPYLVVSFPQPKTLLLRLNRPEQLNAMVDEMEADLCRVRL